MEKKLATTDDDDDDADDDEGKSSVAEKPGSAKPIEPSEEKKPLILLLEPHHKNQWPLLFPSLLPVLLIKMTKPLLQLSIAPKIFLIKELFVS